MRVSIRRQVPDASWFTVTDLDTGEDVSGRTPYNDETNERLGAAVVGSMFFVDLYLLRDGAPYVRPGDEGVAMETVVMTVEEVS